MSAWGLPTGTMNIAATFTASLEALHYAQSAKNFERDHHTEYLMLDIARLRLSRWGEAVGIYEDPELRKPGVTPHELDVARQILLQIQTLMEDTGKALDKVQPADKPDTAAVTDTGNPPLRRVHETVGSIVKRRLKGRGNLTKRVTWAVHHKENAVRLAQNMKRLLDGLEKVFPPAGSAALAREEVTEISSRMEDQSRAAVLTDMDSSAAEVDQVFRNEMRGLTSSSLRIGAVTAMDESRVRNGDYVAPVWNSLGRPEVRSSINVGSIESRGRSRVMNGATYSGTDGADGFWD